MGSSIKLGKVRGIAVGLHWSVLGILVLIVIGLGATSLPEAVSGYRPAEYWIAAVVTGVVFLASILAHELMHSIVAQREGVAVKDITLWLLGGAAQLTGKVRSAGAEFRIAIAGPATSIAIGVVGLALALVLHVTGVSPLVVATVGWLAGINLVLAAFNLVPASPLDGGRVLQAALWKWRGDEHWAAIVAARAGRAFGIVLIALGMVLFLNGQGGLWFVLLGWFLMNVARAEEAHASLEDAFEDMRVRDVMSADPVCVPDDLPVERFLDTVVARHRYATYPLVGADGQVSGLLTFRRLRDAPVPAGATVGSLACPRAEIPVAGPDDALMGAVERLDERHGDGRMLVFDDTRLVGIVSPSDLRRALDLRTVTLRPPNPSDGREQQWPTT